MRFPVRSLAAAQLVALALAITVSVMLVGPPVFQRTAAPDVDQVGRVYAQALEGRALRLLADLAALRNDAVLTRAVETLDGEAIASALEALCGARKLERCEAFDELGEPLLEEGSADGARASVGVSAAERELAGAPRAEIVLSESSGLELRVVGVLGDVASRYGFLRLGVRLDDRFAAEVAQIAGHELVLMDGARVLLASSDSARILGLSETRATLDPAIDRDVITKPPQLTARVSQRAEPPRDLRRLVVGALTTYAFVAFVMSAWILRRFTRKVLALELEIAEATRKDEKALGAIAAEQRERKELEARLERLAELLAIEDGAFASFVRKVSNLATECRTALGTTESHTTELAGPKEVVAVLRHLHTVKSHARLLSLGRIVRAARDAEELASRLLRVGVRRSEEVHTLLEYVHFVASEVESYASLRARFLGEVRDKVTGTQATHTQWLKSLLARLFTELNSGSINLQRLASLHAEYQLAVTCVGKEDLSLYVERFDRMLQDLAARHGKILEPLQLSGNARFFDLGTMEALSDILIHCLRNSLDHGIEAPTKRHASGKPAAGRITIESRLIDRMASLTVRDDGRGLDRKALEAKLVERGAATAEALAALDDLSFFDQLFAAGVTTAESVTELSGRGVGLDVVRDLARKMGGDARIDGAPGQGTSIDIFFPVRGVDASSRVTIFSLDCELKAVAKEHAAIHGVRMVVRGAGFAAADRMVFSQGLRQLVQTVVAATTRPSEVELVVAIGRPAATIEVRIGVSAPDEGTYLESLEKLVDELAMTLLEGGIYAALDEETKAIVLTLPMANPDFLRAIALEVILVTPAADDVRAKLMRVAPAHLGTVNLKVRECLPEIDDSSPAAASILIIDELALAKFTPGSLRERLGDRRTVAIVQCVEIAAVATTRWTIFETEPLLVDGAVDETAIAHALEASLAIAYRRVAENKEAPKLAA